MILPDLNGFGLLCPVVWLADRLRLQMATNGPIRTSRRQLGRHYTSGQIYARPSFIFKSFLPHIATGCVLILSHENHSTKNENAKKA